MDKEMLNKINEVLQADGKRELSLDELEKIFGGGKGGTGEGTRVPQPFDWQKGVECPVCHGTNTVSINGNCICSDCLPQVTPDSDCIPLVIP